MAAAKNGTYAGDDFIRASGEMKDFQQAQLFAWEASTKGSSVHLEAQPTATGIVFEEMNISVVAETGGGEKEAAGGNESEETEGSLWCGLHEEG